MTNRTYTQAEADALILIRRLITAAKKDCPQGCIPTIEVGELEQAITPDAARLALEERDKQIEQLTFSVQSLSDSILAQEQREAKLIADTRLEEAEWWHVRYELHSGVGDPSKCGCGGCSRLAALRAAVQEKLPASPANASTFAREPSEK